MENRVGRSSVVLLLYNTGMEVELECGLLSRVSLASIAQFSVGAGKKKPKEEDEEEQEEEEEEEEGREGGKVEWSSFRWHSQLVAIENPITDR